MADSSHQYDDATRRDVRQTRQPHIPVRCLVELVRADPADEGQHRDHPSWSSRRPPDPGLSAIMSERRRLINLAYRLLDSLAEAEGAVQETYARWYAMSRPQQDAIRSPGAWLTTVASRICLDRSARPGPGGSATWANGSPSRCPNPRSGPAGSPAALPPTRPTG
jgi:cytochrome c1